MWVILLLALIVTPLAEIAVFIQVGGWLGLAVVGWMAVMLYRVGTRRT